MKKVIVGGLLAAAAVAICVIGISILDTIEEIEEYAEESDYNEPAANLRDAASHEERKDG